MFEYCVRLKSIVIPDSVTSMGKWVFLGCTSLEKILIPESVTNIDEKAFLNCNRVTIYGYSDSYAENYAYENGINFNVIS